MQVPNGTGHFCSVEPGPGLPETALPLQVEEELWKGERVDHVSKSMQANLEQG